MSKFLPRNVDLSEHLVGTLGLYEYENAMCHIIRLLQVENNWDSLLHINTIEDHALFAMMCIDGLFENAHLMKYTFKVSDLTIGRLARRVGCTEDVSTKPDTPFFKNSTSFLKI